MATSLDVILTTLQAGVTAINNLNTQLAKVFPQATAASSITPAAGAITFSSSQAAAFLSVTTSSGGIYRIPLY
jgi:hypothetical protein